MFRVYMITLYFLLLLLTSCATTEPGSIEVTDEIFILPGCVEARRVNTDDPC